MALFDPFDTGSATGVDVANPATCSNCRCTDERACAGGCYWLALDRQIREGICSNCQPALKAWRNQKDRPRTKTAESTSRKASK